MITPEENLAKLKLVRKKIAKVKRALKTNKALLDFRKDKNSNSYKMTAAMQIVMEKEIQDCENECAMLESEARLQIRLKKEGKI